LKVVKEQTVTNTLAYYGPILIMIVQRFIVLAPGFATLGRLRERKNVSMRKEREKKRARKRNRENVFARNVICIEMERDMSEKTETGEKGRERERERERDREREDDTERKRE
jgi:hypothetical protein